MMHRRLDLPVAVLASVALGSPGCAADAAGPAAPDPGTNPDSVTPSDLPIIGGSWRRGPDLPRGVFRPEVAYPGGTLYGVGGERSGGRIHTVGGDTARPETTADHFVFTPAGHSP